jgi:hypothetical protein
MLAGNFSAYSNVIYDPNSTSGVSRGNLSGFRLRQHHSHQPFQRDVECDRREQAFPGAPTGHRQRQQHRAEWNIVTSGTGNYYNLTNQFRVDHNINSKMRTTVSYSTGDQHQPQKNVNIVYAPYDQYQTLQYTYRRTHRLRSPT